MEIDGVFSGGGVKAFAFVGAYQVLTEKGYTFKRVAGTSAGSIVAAFIAAGYNVKEMEKALEELDTKSLLDPPKCSKTLPLLKWLNLYFRLGLYKGRILEKWLCKKLGEKGVRTFGDLPEGALKVVASDLSNGRMIVIPDDLHLYGQDWREFSIAKALRMSCGIPFFFEPVKLNTEKGDSIFVDGGVLSNFPLWIYDNGKRVRPLLGLKLSSPITEIHPHKIGNGLHLFEALIKAMMNAHDNRYISRRHEKNIIFIPVEHYNAAQFDLDDEAKKHLIQLGRTKTEEFLQNWRPVV
ncbi:patatin-like phospholipase family protein [Ureibacillus sp. FSL K6-8385]|mgnify:CR=1 FL=1|uniref:Patatin-like phospholipase family protein n=1 Tax=Ureibacillus terrenus TaxID=118246 RepID=A0A540V696_9BACL|nr:patatin-like phospholipase family protein [Ureibacillus terrenus]MED3660719.1 patatin-like phospholipase family protein [Ureibacillus terrenus]MED3762905.1 patatin-like phospholipase family protein [Ureibacillus terrenus]TQE92294.1 patatin-like phospholipase family protein [Ureibacillus terrenus]